MKDEEKKPAETGGEYDHLTDYQDEKEKTDERLKDGVLDFLKRQEDKKKPG